MILTRLSLTNFRNYARLDVDIPDGLVLLVGGNAQGKTSLLEAIYYLAAFVSFQASSDRQLINILNKREPLSVARIVAEFRDTDGSFMEENRILKEHNIEVRIIQGANGANNQSRLRKEALLDGVKCKIRDVVGRFKAVLFQPQMLRLIEGAPEERRRYLNLAMSQVFPHYAALLTEYARILSQRNALLKQLVVQGGNPDQLLYWDDQLATLGAQIIHARILAVKELEHLAAHIHNDLTHNLEILRFSYQPAYDPMPHDPLQYSMPLDTSINRSKYSIEEITQGFLDRLKDLRNEEINRGITTVGPHRDELRFISNGIDLGIYGSRGQARTAVLSLKLAEGAWIKEKTGQSPVLLLDEVLAELDISRRSDLLKRLMESEQVLLTTTDLSLFSDDFIARSKVFKLKAGRLEI
jgi:DNA replication and repair protein RecF